VEEFGSCSRLVAAEGLICVEEFESCSRLVAAEELIYCGRIWQLFEACRCERAYLPWNNLEVVRGSMERSEENRKHGGRKQNEDEAAVRSKVFSELKPLCTELFYLLGNSGHNRPQLLHSLTAYVREAPPFGLQACLE
jgi:hypothetical protein